MATNLTQIKRFKHLRLRGGITNTAILFILAIFYFHNHCFVEAARSLSARRVRNPNGPSRSSADRYDRSITTFHPEGRLLQLEYSLVAAEERGWGLTVCVEWEGHVIFAFPSSIDDNGDDSEGDGGNFSRDSTAEEWVWNYSEKGSQQLIETSKASCTRKSLDTNQSSESDSVLSDMETSSPNLLPTSSEDETQTSSPLPSNLNRAIINSKYVSKHNPTHNTKIHRLSPTHLLLTSGIASDSRTLASAFRRLISRWTHVDYDEVVEARELAKEIGKVRHGIGLRAGARVLGVVGIVIGLDDVSLDINNDERNSDGNAENQGDSLGVEVRMYRSLPGGTMDRCNVCCTGGGADAAGNLARKEALEKLLSVVTVSNERDNSGNQDVDSVDVSNNADEDQCYSEREKRLKNVIEEVGRVALKYHPYSESNPLSTRDEKSNNDSVQKKAAVDIWVVRAVPAKLSALKTVDGPRHQTSKASCHETADDHLITDQRSHSLQHTFVSPHRRLGKASMDISYARRVSFDQVSAAAQCLIRKN